MHGITAKPVYSGHLGTDPKTVLIVEESLVSQVHLYGTFIFAMGPQLTVLIIV